MTKHRQMPPLEALRASEVAERLLGFTEAEELCVIQALSASESSRWKQPPPAHYFFAAEIAWF